MDIRGFYYNGNDSSRLDVTVTFYDSFIHISNKGERVCEIPRASIEISKRIGDAPRKIYLPDGASVESYDNDLIDKMLEATGKDAGARFIYNLEKKWRYVFIAVIFTVLFSFGSIMYGVPALAKGVAFALPAKTGKMLASDTLDYLDKYLFAPSELPDGKKEVLEREFSYLLKSMPKGFDYNLKFRKSKIGPNAFALPDGTVVMTDELVELSENDLEIVGVLAHELGHVVNRHGVRTVLQNSAVGVIALAITGDATSLAIAIPTFLLESKYSREFELEADRFAIKTLSENNIPVKHLGDILLRLTGEHDGGEVTRYISTHPSTKERIDIINEADSRR